MNKFTKIGAAAGLALFLAVGLLPALLYGGYAGVMLASGIFGAPLVPTLAARALIIFGMVMGAVGVGSLFTVGGAVAGATINAVVSTADGSKRVRSNA